MWRFGIGLIAVVIIGSISLGKMFDAISQQQSAHQLSNDQQRLMSQVKLISAAINTGFEQAQLTQWLALSSAQSNARYELQSLKDYPLPDTLIAELEANGVVFLESSEGLTAYALLNHSNVLLITQPIPSEISTTSWLLTLGFYLILLCIVLAFLAPFLLRLYKLRNTAVAFGEGQLDKRLIVGSFWYLKDIELAFNQMAERLEQLMRDVQLLSGGLSHELRTPLARVRMGLDTLCETDNPQQRQGFEMRINQNLDDMEGLINALLNFARLQHMLDSSKKSPIDLYEIVAKQVAKTHDSRCQFNANKGQYIIEGNRHYVELLLSNLITNAFKHSQDKVALTLSNSQAHIILTVSDDGAGIDFADREKAFKPFVRLAENSESGKQGFGIGLALVERITRWLGGNIKVDSCSTLGGALFEVKLPKY